MWLTYEQMKKWRKFWLIGPNDLETQTKENSRFAELAELSVCEPRRILTNLQLLINEFSYSFCKKNPNFLSLKPTSDSSEFINFEFVNLRF